jgi:hypothetical protein
MTKRKKKKTNSERLAEMISKIKAGNCVAFIGAGFNAPAVRTWDQLLTKLSDNPNLHDEVKLQVKSFLEHAETAQYPLFDREAAAELIESDLVNSDIGDIFRREVQNSLFRDGADGHTQISERRKLLEKIPFDSVLTTNFDSQIPGASLKNADLSKLLRTRSIGWSDAKTLGGSVEGSQVITLHGDVNDDSEDASPLVFSRSGYRRLLFETSNYQSLVRTVFATKTVVFLGFSFSDSYLNLIRSEVLSMLYPKGPDGTIAYAVMDDLLDDQVDYLQNHEGISPITYDTNDRTDYSGFQKILKQISEETEPAQIATKLLAGRKIMWFDPNSDNNREGVEVLRRHMGAANVIQESDLSRAKETLQSDEIDLLITHWGHDLAIGPDATREPNAYPLLRLVRANNLQIPVLVFASGDYADVNRSAALRYGALDYVDQFHDLFSRIEDIFKGALKPR